MKTRAVIFLLFFALHPTKSDAQDLKTNSQMLQRKFILIQSMFFPEISSFKGPCFLFCFVYKYVMFLAGFCMTPKSCFTLGNHLNGACNHFEKLMCFVENETKGTEMSAQKAQGQEVCTAKIKTIWLQVFIGKSLVFSIVYNVST